MTATLVQDGEVVTACSRPVPTEAIVFGNLNDPSSEVASCTRTTAAYGVLLRTEHKAPRPTSRNCVIRPTWPKKITEPPTNRANNGITPAGANGVAKRANNA